VSTASAAPPSAGSGDPAVALVIVLAAGAGTRMRSSLPKVLHPLAGRPLLWHALSAVGELSPAETIAVVGSGREQVGDYLRAAHPDVRIVVQAEQRGTGHAVASALQGRAVPSGTVLVSYGDVPLLTPDTLRALVSAHTASHAAVTVLTAEVDDPAGYGRIVRTADGGFAAIVEHRDATAEQLAVSEINSGVYAFDGETLAGLLPRLSPSNAAGEQYLTDVVGLAKQDGRSVGTVQAAEAGEIEGVNDRVQLADLARRLNDRLVRRLQLSGVTVLDPATTWLHAGVEVGPDTVLHRNTSLEAGTVVGAGCVIGPDTTLIGCSVADGATVLRSHCEQAVIGERAAVGPFTYLRPAAELAAGAKTGAFVEVKKSIIGPGAKVPHLAYVGDAEIGAGSNLGAGTITANYDGVTKSRTVVGRESFVGSNSTLVAPVSVADGAYVAAGSTITGNVGPGDLGIARSRQKEIPNWVLRRRSGTPSESAALTARSAAQPDTAPDADSTAAAGKDLRS
jgi:bifunctional UDP-N-acetylglucosamine pyrophosphorylase / glucosamine-1-phosphate N-acetyltransferase